MSDKVSSLEVGLDLGVTHYRHTEKLGSARGTVLCRALDSQLNVITASITPHRGPIELSDKRSLSSCSRIAHRPNELLGPE
jgi:hypothetical protein